jgi:peptidyl-tRNA hydrolase
LGKWKPSELDIIEPRIEVAANFIKSFVTQGVDQTMNQMNNK